MFNDQMRNFFINVIKMNEESQKLKRAAEAEADMNWNYYMSITIATAPIAVGLLILADKYVTPRLNDFSEPYLRAALDTVSGFIPPRITDTIDRVRQTADKVTEKAYPFYIDLKNFIHLISFCIAIAGVLVMSPLIFLDILRQDSFQPDPEKLMRYAVGVIPLLPLFIVALMNAKQEINLIRTTGFPAFFGTSAKQEKQHSSSTDPVEKLQIERSADASNKTEADDKPEGESPSSSTNLTFGS